MPIRFPVRGLHACPWGRTFFSMSAYSDKFKITKSYADKTRKRICRLTDNDPITGCWNWKKYRNKCGYGMMGFNGFVVGVHRISYLLFVGDLIDGMEICHTCDNPACANPDHLFQATHAENIKDCFRKGRLNFCKMERNGENNSASTISDAMILEARSMLNRGMRGVDVARALKIGQSSVSRIKRGFRQ